MWEFAEIKASIPYTQVVDDIFPCCAHVATYVRLQFVPVELILLRSSLAMPDYSSRSAAEAGCGLLLHVYLH